MPRPCQCSQERADIFRSTAENTCSAIFLCQSYKYILCKQILFTSTTIYSLVKLCLCVFSLHPNQSCHTCKHRCISKRHSSSTALSQANRKIHSEGAGREMWYLGRKNECWYWAQTWNFAQDYLKYIFRGIFFTADFLQVSSEPSLALKTSALHIYQRSNAAEVCISHGYMPQSNPESCI